LTNRLARWPMCTPNQMSLEVESLPALADSSPPLRQIDLEHVQASPIPLHYMGTATG